MHNLIRPLGSTHNFTQSGWLILFIPNHLSGQHKLGKLSNTLFGWTTAFSADVSLSALQLQQQHGHNEGSCLIYGPLAFISLRPRVPSWIWIRKIQYTTHRNNFMSPPKLAISTAMQNSVLTPSDFTSGQHFLETFMLLPETTRTTNSWWLQRFSPQTANTTFATLWRTYLPCMSNDTRCFLHSLITSFRFLTSRLVA